MILFKPELNLRGLLRVVLLRIVINLKKKKKERFWGVLDI